MLCYVIFFNKQNKISKYFGIFILILIYIHYCIFILLLNSYKKLKMEKSNTCNLYAWGFAKYGQIGKKFYNLSVKPHKVELVNTEEIFSIFAGESHSMIMTISPKLYAFGKNLYGQLGLGQPDSVFNHYINFPTLNLISCQHKIQKVSCGGDHTILLTEDNQVITFGLNVFGQLGIGKFSHLTSIPILLNSNDPDDEFSLTKILGKDEHVVEIAAGAQHSCLLTNRNNIYTCGSNNFKALGFINYNIQKNLTEKNDDENEKEKDKVRDKDKCQDKDKDKLKEQGKDDFNSSKPKSNVLNNSNGNNQELYTVIDEENSDSCVFSKISFTIAFKSGLSKLSAGVYHTAVLVDQEKVCIWGEGEVLNFSQPKIFNLENEEYFTPNKMKTSSSKITNQIKDIKLTQDLLMILTKKNEIFTMGCNTKGQLGIGNTKNSTTLVRVNLPIQKSSKVIQLDSARSLPSTEDISINYKVKQIELGNEFAIVSVICFSDDKSKDSSDNVEVFGWGSNEYGQLTVEDAIIIYSPVNLTSLKGMEKIVCGGYHCLGLESNFTNELHVKESEKDKAKEVKMLKSKSSSTTVLEKIESKNIFQDSPVKNNFKRLNSVDDFHLEKKDFGALSIEEMKDLLLQMPISSTLKNDYCLIKEKMKIVNDLNSKSKELEETYRKNEQKIFELKKIEKELQQKIESQGSTKDEKSLSRGFTNTFEIHKDEIEITGEIGKGTYGIVYKAHWRKMNVAVKLIKEDMLTQEDSLKGFQDECAFMKNLRHPNILLFMGAGTKGPEYFIVTELCEQGNLFELLHNKKNIPIGWEDKRRLALEIAYGMNYLHSYKPPILHRDLKSMNVLLNKYWQVKIADFGNTKFLQIHMTKQKGTFQWMAPEVILHPNYTEKADVFSFGIIMSELMSRQPPYFGVDKKIVAKQVSQNPSYRPAIPKTCPKDWADLMKRCWDHLPNKRPTFNEIIESLQKAKF
jgi:alpha-tubulin suppressor-like RCC1 family protein